MSAPSLYCDNYCPINYSKLFADFCNNKAKIQITAYSNRDNYTKSNLHITDDGLITTYDKKRIIPNLQGVDIGYALVDKSVISLISEENCNFEEEVYPQLVAQNKLFATMTEHQYYSVLLSESNLRKNFLNRNVLCFSIVMVP